MQTFETYLRTEAGLSDATVEAYVRDTAQYLDSVEEDPFESCLIDQFIQAVEDRYRPNTLKRKQMSLVAFYKYLISNRLVENNVLDGLVCLRSDDPPIEVRNEDEISSLLKALDGKNEIRDKAIILLMYQSGLRVSEVCNLQSSNIMWGNAAVRVRGKGSIERIVPITDDCLNTLGLIVRDAVGNNVFNVSRHAITDMVTRTSNRAGIKHTTSHTLRHTCATTLLEGGMPIGDIQSLLGHSNVSTTQKYLQVSTRRLKEVYATCHPRQ